MDTFQILVVVELGIIALAQFVPFVRPVGRRVP